MSKGKVWLVGAGPGDPGLFPSYNAPGKDQSGPGGGS